MFLTRIVSVLVEEPALSFLQGYFSSEGFSICFCFIEVPKSPNLPTNSVHLVKMDEELAAVMADHAEQVVPETVEPVEPPSIDSLPQPMAVLKRSTGDVENNTECIFYILGTAHVSRKSCEDAAMLINLIKPDLVLVELCSERQAILHVEKKTEVGV
jgi:hypothetical protein